MVVILVVLDGASEPRGDVLAASERASRVDVRLPDGTRAPEVEARLVAAELDRQAPDHRVQHLSGHRLLVCGLPPAPTALRREDLPVWPEGAVPPCVLDSSTVVVAAGAAAGLARLVGARVVIPDGATGQPDTDLCAKAWAAAAALVAQATAQVVIHVGGADEAAHVRNSAGKAAFVAATREANATLQISPDHGCGPATGLHDAAPRGGSATRLTERAAALA